MSRLVLTLLGVGLVVAGLGTAGAGVGTTHPETELRSEVKALKTQIEKLEARLQALEKQSASGDAARVLALPPNVTLDLQPAPPKSPAPHIPPNAVQREFNGTPYYIIPIHQSGGNAPTATTVIAEPAQPAR